MTPKTALFPIAASLIATSALAQPVPELPDGLSRTGEITRQSRTMTENVVYVDLYEVRGEEGERISIDLMSDDFDSFLEIGRIEDGQFVQLASDDDGGDELNSRLVFTFPDSGAYTVRARPLGADTLGAYLIELNRLPPPPPPPPPSAIARGQSVEGVLTVDSASYSSDAYGAAMRFYDLYSIAGEAGDRVTVTLLSDDFDSFLEAGGMTPLGFAAAASNDDAANPEGGESLGLNAQLELTFAQAGTIMIRATSLGGGETGRYTLQVD